MKTTSGQAHGKIILMGEHAVVYGQPAIALPFPSVHVQAQIEEKEGEIEFVSDFYSGPLSQAPEDLECFPKLLQQLEDDLHWPMQDFIVTINSSIPTGRGLGSSAAVAGALVEGLSKYFDQELSSKQALHYIDFSEKITHGNPSGLDARITQSHHAIYYVKNQEMTPFPMTMDAFLVVADTGQLGKTKETVADVRRQVENNEGSSRQDIECLGQLSKQAYQALLDKQPDTLGKAMNQAQLHLDRLGLSSSRLDHLISTAQKSGALGAKLIGGGRGGCMIALCQDQAQAQDLAQRLKEEKASHTWIYQLQTGESHV